MHSLTRVLSNLGYKGYRVTSSNGAGWRVTRCNPAWVTGLQNGLGGGVTDPQARKGRAAGKSSLNWCGLKMPARADSSLVLCYKKHKTQRAPTVTLSLTVTNCRNGLTVPHLGITNPRVNGSIIRWCGRHCRFSSDRPTARKASSSAVYPAWEATSHAVGPALAPRLSDPLPILSPRFVPHVSPEPMERMSAVINSSASAGIEQRQQSTVIAGFADTDNRHMPLNMPPKRTGVVNVNSEPDSELRPQSRAVAGFSAHCVGKLSVLLSGFVQAWGRKLQHDD